MTLHKTKSMFFADLITCGLLCLLGLLLLFSSCQSTDYDDNIGGKYDHHHQAQFDVWTLRVWVDELRARVEDLERRCPE